MTPSESEMHGIWLMMRKKQKMEKMKSKVRIWIFWRARTFSEPLESEIETSIWNWRPIQVVQTAVRMYFIL